MSVYSQRVAVSSEIPNWRVVDRRIVAYLVTILVHLVHEPNCQTSVDHYNGQKPPTCGDNVQGETNRNTPLSGNSVTACARYQACDIHPMRRLNQKPNTRRIVGLFRRSQTRSHKTYLFFCSLRSCIDLIFCSRVACADSMCAVCSCSVRAYFL